MQKGPAIDLGQVHIQENQIKRLSSHKLKGHTPHTLLTARNAADALSIAYEQLSFGGIPVLAS
jgi:hypothetical protein